MPDRSRRPRDSNQLAKLIVDIATGETDDTPADNGKNPAAVELGRKGGLKGGKARVVYQFDFALRHARTASHAASTATARTRTVPST
jgi:hypothetical protein